MTTEIDIDLFKTYVIDTYVWYEYFTGSDIGVRIKDFIEKGNLITPSIVVAEIVNKFSREGKPYAEFVQFLKLRSEIVPVDSDVAEEAGNLRTRFSKNKISMADAIIMAVAKIRNLKIVSGDEYFRNLKNVIMIK